MESMSKNDATFKFELEKTTEENDADEDEEGGPETKEQRDERLFNLLRFQILSQLDLNMSSVEAKGACSANEVGRLIKLTQQRPNVCIISFYLPSFTIPPHFT